MSSHTQSFYLNFAVIGGLSRVSLVLLDLPSIPLIVFPPTYILSLCVLADWLVDKQTEMEAFTHTAAARTVAWLEQDNRVNVPHGSFREICFFFKIVFDTTY